MTKYREIKSRIISFVAENDLIQPGDRIIIAVSGGMDSMFLLNVLSDLKDELSIDIAVGHINHNLRPNSKMDEEFVIEQAKRLRIKCQIKQLKYADKVENENIEAWARHGRYKKLEEIRTELKFDKIATAHHSNDQIETMLHRLSEKSGIEGLRGIHKQRGKIIRPILHINRQEIEETVKELSIEYIVDETNQDTTLTRNYFRHKVIPQWEALYPRLGKSFQRITEYQERNQRILEYFFDDLKRKFVHEQTDATISIDTKCLNNLPDYISITFLHYLMDGSNWRKHNWYELEKIYKYAKPGKIYSFKEVEILNDREKLLIRPKFNVDQKPIKVTVGNSLNIGDQIIKVQKVDKVTLDNNPKREYIDKTKINSKILILRPWRDGDTIKPLNMEGSKLVSDYLIDKKMNSFEKQKQLVMTADDEIIWLCGQRISEIVKIDNSTKEYLELSIQ